jgi:hypothetical protein
MAVKRRWRFYTTAAGRSPVRDFLTAVRLSSDDRDEILAAMKDVQVNGLWIARHLIGDVYEVRADGRQATYRVLFAAEGKSSQVLLGQKRITQRMGTSQGQVTRFESGADTRLATVARYPAALGVQIDWTITPARRTRRPVARATKTRRRAPVRS